MSGDQATTVELAADEAITDEVIVDEAITDESIADEAIADEAISGGLPTRETPTEEPSAAAESPRRGVEEKPPQGPKRANGEQSPTLKAAALDEQTEE